MGKGALAIGAGDLQVSVVEGRNFAVKEMGRGTLDSCVELLLGEVKVRTEIARETLTPNWLADFSLTVPSQDSNLWVSVLDEDQFFGREVLIGRAVVPINDLVGCGRRILWLHVKNLDNIIVGEVCLGLRYTNYQSAEDKDTNPPGLKALLSSSEASSSDNVKSPTDSEQPQLRCVEVLRDIEPDQLIPHVSETDDEAGQIGLSACNTESGCSKLYTLDLEVNLKQVKRLDGGGRKSCSYACQYKMWGFTGAMMTILLAFVVGNHQKKRSEDQLKVKSGKSGIRYA